MAKARDATKPGVDGSPPLVTILELPGYVLTGENIATEFKPAGASPHHSLYIDFLAEVRSLLSQNRPVLVRGWKRPNSCRFTKKGLQLLRGSLDQDVEWQGMLYTGTHPVRSPLILA